MAVAVAEVDFDLKNVLPRIGVMDFAWNTGTGCASDRLTLDLGVRGHPRTVRFVVQISTRHFGVFQRIVTLACSVGSIQA